MVDLAMVVRFNILAAALRVAANLFFELSICVVMSGCMCACVDSNFSSPSGSKCHHLQCLLLRAKANALRLNELSLTDLMHITALTPTQLVINRA